MKIKKPIKTKFRMPVFNWVALKPNQINGTVFNEIDDERILEVLQLQPCSPQHCSPQHCSSHPCSCSPAAVTLAEGSFQVLAGQ